MFNKRYFLTKNKKNKESLKTTVANNTLERRSEPRNARAARETLQQRTNASSVARPCNARCEMRSVSTQNVARARDQHETREARQFHGRVTAVLETRKIGSPQKPVLRAGSRFPIVRFSRRKFFKFIEMSAPNYRTRIKPTYDFQTSFKNFGNFVI